MLRLPFSCVLLLSLATAEEIPSASTSAQSSSPASVENREYVTVCPTNDRRAARVDPDAAAVAQVVTTNCAVTESVSVDADGTLVLSDRAIDMVLSYPDAATLNFARNAIDYFPSDASITAARSLILRGNKFQSLTDVEVPPELEYLDVGACEISTVGAKSTYPASLVKLRLGGNELTTLRGMSFPSHLRALELDDQPLRSLANAALPSTLEILTASNTSIAALNASTDLPTSLTRIDVSFNNLSVFPDFYTFPSITEVNVSGNSIRSIVGIQFPWTLKKLDLRGNPLSELEITRSDLKLFQAWSYLLPPVSQNACKNAAARKVRLDDVDVCVLEDSDFNRIYGKSSASDEAGISDIPATDTPSPSLTQWVEPATESASHGRNPFTWAFLIIAVTTIAIVVIGVITTLSWKHQQLRRKMKKILERNSHMRTSSFNGDLLRVVGLEGELAATRFNTGDIKILHVLGKAGYGLIYLGELREGEGGGGGGDDGDQGSTPRLVLDDQDRRSALSVHSIFSSHSALSLQDLERGSVSINKQLVSLKRLVPEQATDKSPSLRTFVQEIQLMSQLDHPKIISFLGVCWNTLADVTMVMEYLPNGDLRTLLKIDSDRIKLGHSKKLRWMESQSSFASTLSIRTAVLPSKSAIALDIAQALAYLHSFEPPVLHRELRSKHVLFNEHYEAKLSNFAAPSEYHLDVTKTVSLDSVAWLAPEILRGEPYTDKTDIYAFGILLAELATGTRPFEGLANAAVALKVTHDHERPSLNDADCPSVVQHFAQLCMSADPRERPSAAEAQHELGSLRKGSHL